MPADQPVQLGPDEVARALADLMAGSAFGEGALAGRDVLCHRGVGQDGEEENKAGENGSHDRVFRLGGILSLAPSHQAMA